MVCFLVYFLIFFFFNIYFYFSFFLKPCFIYMYVPFVRMRLHLSYPFILFLIFMVLFIFKFTIFFQFYRLLLLPFFLILVRLLHKFFCLPFCSLVLHTSNATYQLTHLASFFFYLPWYVLSSYPAKTHSLPLDTSLILVYWQMSHSDWLNCPTVRF